MLNYPRNHKQALALMQTDAWQKKSEDLIKDEKPK